MYTSTFIRMSDKSIAQANLSRSEREARRAEISQKIEERKKARLEKKAEREKKFAEEEKRLAEEEAKMKQAMENYVEMADPMLININKFVDAYEHINKMKEIGCKCNCVHCQMKYVDDNKVKTPLLEFVIDLDPLKEEDCDYGSLIKELLPIDIHGHIIAAITKHFFVGHCVVEVAPTSLDFYSSPRNAEKMCDVLDKYLSHDKYHITWHNITGDHKTLKNDD